MTKLIAVFILVLVVSLHLHLLKQLLLLFVIHILEIWDIAIKFMRPVVIAAMLILSLLSYLL